MFSSGDRIGSYVLKEKLGRGAFGTVWLAEETTAITSHKVALKLPNEEQIDLEEIRNEAAVWEKVKGHPNVLPIIKADIFDGQVFIASEYAPDGSLSDLLKRQSGRTLGPQLAVDMMKGILAGLVHLHSLGVVHRDMKPDNILLQGETPRIADFGIARILKGSQSLHIAGTPNYMAPEGFRGVRSAQTDIWAAGVMLYQMLTGLLLFPQSDLPSLVNAIVNEPICIDTSQIPAKLRQIVDTALRKDPVERYQTAAAMLRDLKNIPGSELSDLSTLPTLDYAATETGDFEAVGRGSSQQIDPDETLPLRPLPDTIPAGYPTENTHANRLQEDAGRSKTKWAIGAVAAIGVGASLVWGVVALTRSMGVGDSNSGSPLTSKADPIKKVPLASAPDRRVLWAEWAGMIENSKYDDVVTSTTKEIARDPDDPIPYRMRAMAYFNLKQDDLGTLDIREVYRLSSDPVSAEEFEAACYALGRLNKLEDAMQRCDRAIELDPDLSFAYNVRGSLHFQKHLYEDAVNDFTKAIDLTPRGIFYKNRAEAYLALGKMNLAQDDDVRARAMDPNASQPINTNAVGSSQNSEVVKTRNLPAVVRHHVSEGSTAVGGPSPTPNRLKGTPPTPSPKPSGTPNRVFH